MKDLVKKFLSESDKDNIREAVKQAESRTSGEIVPLVVSASYEYPMANVTGGAAMALLPAILLTPAVGGLFWIGAQNMWVFMGLFTLLFAVFHVIVKRVPWLKRLFVPKKEIDEEVEEAAVTSFYKEGLYRTRDATGVLIFISVFEHKVWVLADRGINAQVPNSEWGEIVDGIVRGIKEKKQGVAICDAILGVGEILCKHFPIKPDDTNELDDLIIRD